MGTPRKIAFLFDEFTAPARQLLDRFLMPYAHDGAVHAPAVESISVFLASGTSEPELKRREKDFHLTLAASASEAVAGADALVIAGASGAVAPSASLVRAATTAAPAGVRCFIHGAVAASLESGRDMLKAAASRQISVSGGTPLPVTWRLPEVELSRGAHVTDALIVVQGASAEAELNGLDGLLPLIERRHGGETGVRRVQRFEGGDVWRAGDKKAWSWPLLAAALSRSDSPQGDAVRDGRTQDLVGLGLVQKLARNPRAWVIEHRDGLRSAILVLDGVVNDINFAIRAKEGSVLSAQLFRAAAPAEHHFSRLAITVERFFATGEAPWPIERNLLIAGLLEVFKLPEACLGTPFKTPALDIRYQS